MADFDFQRPSNQPHSQESFAENKLSGIERRKSLTEEPNPHSNLADVGQYSMAPQCTEFDPYQQTETREYESRRSEVEVEINPDSIAYTSDSNPLIKLRPQEAERPSINQSANPFYQQQAPERKRRSPPVS